MSNTSATGAYLTPTSTVALPGNLTLDQFLQTVLTQISGLDGTLVRPKWQENPPKQPNIKTNWLSFRVNQIIPDTYGYVGLDANQNTVTARHEELHIGCSFYGPNALDYVGVVRDGFQIRQNLEALSLAKMGFNSTGNITLAPDLVNERWVNRYEMEIVLRRMVQRSYAVLTFVSAGGTLLGQTAEGIRTLNWQTPEES